MERRRVMYTAPSVKRLMDTFPITKQQAKKVRAIIHGVDYNSNFSRYHYSVRILNVLESIQDTIGLFYGVEYISEYGGIEYLNTGDTYGVTILYRYKTDTFSIGSWGDIAERGR